MSNSVQKRKMLSQLRRVTIDLYLKLNLICFHRPRSDTCSVCDKLKIRLENESLQEKV